MDQEPKQQQKRSPLVLVLIIIIVLLVAVAVVLAVSKFGGQQLEPAPVSSGGDGTPKIGYQEGVTVIDDSDALKKAYTEMREKNQQMGVPLSYRYEAKSKDGENFECYIANPNVGGYDMFIAVYADAEFQDQLYLSGLIPPGSVLENLKTEHKLERGENEVYVAFTQVEDDHATIHQQVVVALNFIVE